MTPVSHQMLRRLTYFAVIAETGSIRGAADRMGLSVPVLSEALSDLEAELGVTLATRTTRRFELTEAGQSIQKSAAEMLRLAQSTTQYAHPNQPLEGRLVLTLPVELAMHWIARRLATFQARHPAVRFEIDASDHIATLKNSPFDLAIRTRYVSPGTAQHKAPCLPLCCVARTAPWVKQHRDGVVLDTAIIGPRATRSLRARRGDEDVQITSESTLTVDNRGVAVALAMQGLGATLVVEASVTQALEAGQLVRVMPGYDFGHIALDYVFRDALPSPAAKAFVEMLEGQQA